MAKDPLDYLNADTVEEFAKAYEHETHFYEALGTEGDNFNIICAPMTDGTTLSEEEKTEIIYSCIENNVDLVYQLSLDDGASYVTFIVDPLTLKPKSDKVGVVPYSDYKYHC